MQLLEKGANAVVKDSEGRTPKDFASASDKIWGHFAAEGHQRTPKPTLIEMGIIKKVIYSNVIHIYKLPGQQCSIFGKGRAWTGNTAAKERILH